MQHLSVGANIFGLIWSRGSEDALAHLGLTRVVTCESNLLVSLVSNTDTRFGTVIHFRSTDGPLTHIVAALRCYTLSSTAGRSTPPPG